MARIIIGDLPPVQDPNPGEMARIFGAGRRRRRNFPRSFDALEPRELFAGDLVGAFAIGETRPATTTDDSLVRPFDLAPNSPVQGTALASPSPSAGGLVVRGAPPHKIETTFTDHNGPYGNETWKQRWFMDDDRVAYELQIFAGNRNGQRIGFGTERNAGTQYVVELSNLQGQPTSTSVFQAPAYDTRGDGVNLITRTTFLPNGQGRVDGKRNQSNQWVETTTGSKAFKAQIAVFDKPGGTLLTRTTTANDGSVIVGKLGADTLWVETTTGSKAFRAQTAEFAKPGGTLLARITIANDGSKIDGQRAPNGQWVETTTGSPDFQTQTSVFDKVGGTLLSRTTLYTDGSKVVGTLGPNGIWTETKVGPVVANSTTRLDANGDVTVRATDGSSSQIYQKVANAWKLVFWERQTPAGWTQETWGANGRYEQDVWSSKMHGPVGSVGSISQAVIANGVETVTLFHKTGGYDSFGYLFFANPQWYVQACKDATIRWTYNVNPDGSRGALQEYYLFDDHNTYNGAAWWKLNPPSDWYTDGTKRVPGGWYQGFPGGKNSRGKFLPPPGFPASVSLNTRAATVAAPPGVTATTAPVNGGWAETIWNQARTQSLTFVYSGQDQKDLIRQTYGRSEGGKWVETTDHSRAFITQTATFDKPGGTIQSSVTVRKTPDGRDVTFTGTWTSGTAVANATGIETAGSYLGFSSVTVQYRGGKPVQRSGPLESFLGGRFATDTFDGSGTAVVKREISNAKGTPVVETWTGSANDFTISRVAPAPNISKDSARFQRTKQTGNSIELFNYQATFVKPVDLSFDGGEVNGSTSYAWRQFYSKDDEHYREKGSRGREYNASSAPYPQVAGFSAPKSNDYWSKV